MARGGSVRPIWLGAALATLRICWMSASSMTPPPPASLGWAPDEARLPVAAPPLGCSRKPAWKGCRESMLSASLWERPCRAELEPHASISGMLRVPRLARLRPRVSPRPPDR